MFTFQIVNLNVISLLARNIENFAFKPIFFRIFSSESAEEAQHQNLSNDFEEEDTNTKSKFYSNEEPLYPSAGIVSRRAPVVESKGPVFELKLNITDSDFIVVVEPSLLDSSAVILRSTTVIGKK